MPLTVLPLQSKKIHHERFDIFLALSESLKSNNVNLHNGDVLVVSTKFVSVSQGRILNLNNVHDVSESGMLLSKRYALSPKVAEVILRESNEILGGMVGFVIAESVPFVPMAPDLLHIRNNALLKNSSACLQPVPYYLYELLCDLPSRGVLAPNAGIDMSNTKSDNEVVLYPSSPFETAEMLRRKVFLYFDVTVGVILADSRLMPTRVGTSAVAVAYAGLSPVADRRSKLDLDGNPLKVTFQATSDNIATIANHTMGEAAESRPFAIVRDSDVVLTGRRPRISATMVSADQCVYVRGLSERNK